jgi:ubiquitin carboxyl-terminal hydrolase 5/13
MEILASFESQVKVPTANDNIYSEECVFSFDNPVRRRISIVAKLSIFILLFLCQESETGLYVSLTSFLGFGKDHVERYYQKTKHAVFLHIKRNKTEVIRVVFEVNEG